MQELEYDIQNLEPELATISKEVSLLQDELENAEEASLGWQTRWDEFNQSSSKTAQTAQVEKNNIQHLEQSISSLQKRHEQFLRDQGQFNFADLNNEIAAFAKESEEVSCKLEDQNQQLLDTRDEITSLQTAQQESNRQLDQVRRESQQLRGQQASLEALQQTALGQRDNPAAPWVKEHNLGGKPRLAQHIEVENGWELAVEKVLGFSLQAICVDQVGEVVPHLDQFKSGNLCVFTQHKHLHLHLRQLIKVYRWLIRLNLHGHWIH